MKAKERNALMLLEIRDNARRPLPIAILEDVPGPSHIVVVRLLAGLHPPDADVPVPAPRRDEVVRPPAGRRPRDGRDRRRPRSASVWLPRRAYAFRSRGRVERQDGRGAIRGLQLDDLGACRTMHC